MTRSLTSIVITFVIGTWATSALAAQKDTCRAQLAALKTAYASIEAQTQKAVQDAEGMGLVEGLRRLQGQHIANCKVEVNLPSGLTSRDVESVSSMSRVRLGLAMTHLLLKHGVPWAPQDLEWSALQSNVPFTGDEAFDTSEYCYHLTGDASFLTPQEFNAWNARREKLRGEQERAVQALSNAIRGEGQNLRWEYGKVKSVQKKPDGSLVLSMKRLEGGYQCLHTGTFTYTNGFWSDCSYKMLPAKESYGFSVTVSRERIPSADIQVGDVLQVTGLFTAGKGGGEDGASYDARLIPTHTRGKSVLSNLDLSQSLSTCAPYRK
jgi:hypothetical protein